MLPRLRIAGFALLLLTTFTSRTMGDDLPTILNSKPVKANPEDSAVRKLQIERYNAVIEELRGRYLRVQGGQEPADRSFNALKRLASAGLELNDRPAGRAALLEECLEVAKALETIVQNHVSAGHKNFVAADAAQVKSYRADFEIQWLRAKEKLKGEKK
jgi:hypothetical protein